MRSRACAVAAALLLYMGGCAGLPPELPADPGSLPACAAGETTGIGISVSTLAIRMPSELASNVALDTLAPVSKRIVITSTAHWYRVSMRTLGGTLEAWTRLEAGGALVEAASDASSPQNSHAARGRLRIEAEKGGLTITRPAEPNDTRATAIMADVVLLPGGVPVDESVLRIQQLWDAKGAALEPSVVRVDLEPARHVPGFDAIEAELVLDYVHWNARTRAACRGSAMSRATLVDKDAVRPPLWDLGVSTLNQSRTQWLGLRDSQSGVFRAVFDSPTAATSFANWIRATRSTRVGPYEIGLFERDGYPLRPLVPVDRGAPDTFQPITEDQQDHLRVGPLGGP
jgi:hypothetical protein